jgi:acetylcholinesterase
MVIYRGDPNAVRGQYSARPKWPAYTPAEPKMVVFGEDNDENAGGGHRGTAVSIANNTYALEECKYWWERTELFES